ncbi:MAG: uroporphyrinogen-III synthase [Bauldia sp.]|mgnify:CR=1 FL=1
MRLLVTRPEPDASRTAERLRSAGHEAIVEPLLAAVAAPVPDIGIAPAALAVTSRNAVRALLNWPQVADWRQRVTVFAVGDATAAAARAAGFADVRSAEGDVDDLVRLIVRERRAVAGSVLYVAGEVRRGDLGGGLRAAGISVAEVEAYRMQPAAVLSEALTLRLRGGALDGALFYSERTAAVFADLVGEAPLGTVTAYALSAAAALPLDSLGFRSVAIASRPNEDALFALIPRSAEKAPSA